MKKTPNSSTYRRGIMLGLTMAEIMILIIFLLLLGFAVLLQKEKDFNKSIIKNEDKIESIIRIFAENKPNLNADIVRIVEELPPLLKEVEKQNEINEEEVTADQIVIAIEKFIRQKQLQENLNSGESLEEKLLESLERQKELEKEKNVLRDQKKSLIAQIQDKGRGVDWPPCWPDSEGHASEYIFKIDLTDDGIIFENAAPPHRLAEMAKLPIQNIIYETPRTIGEFRRETAKLFKWSTNNECRFYVRVYDKTGAEQKALFKRLLTTVEGVFYKKMEIVKSQPELKKVKKKKSFWSGFLEGDEKKNETRERYN